MNAMTNRQPTQPTFSVASDQPPAVVAVSTADQQLLPVAEAPVRGRPFKKGQSGNPNGRPKGSRNRLTDSVLKKIAEDFATHGDEVLERVRNEEPALYLKFIISLLPRELVMQFEQHRHSEVSALEQSEIFELAHCNQKEKLVEQASRTAPTTTLFG
jgi:hypothetical protein